MSKAKEVFEVELNKDVIESLKYEARTEDIPVDKVIENMLSDGFFMTFFDVGESVVKLKYIDPWSGVQTHMDEVGEDGEETPANLAVYRRLREEFPPVTAGVDYSKSFTSGSGFDVKIDDPTDQHQQMTRDTINTLNREIFMDDLTIGLKTILDIVIDDTFTDGVGAAEIVYDNWDEEGMKFIDWATPTPNPEKGSPKWTPKVMEDSDWKKLGGVKQLKIIANSYTRLKPYRDPKTWQILYFTVDEGKEQEEGDVVKLLPWQVLWLSWNRRRSSLKGISMIRPVVKTALLLESIMTNLGVSFSRWADKKYFFILGDARSGRSWAPENIRNFLNDFGEMAKNNKSGIPVPAGFDVKTIGGEVYDGGAIIGNLISMICGGMKYPRTFLEQGKTQEGDKAWMAWLVAYGRYQSQLKESIQHQLWKRHLYCKYGMKRTIPKQGVPSEKQEIENIYVPRMEWSSEGRWHRETKLTMLKDWLNTANPVTPIFKIGIEEDAAITLGYTELIFEDVRKEVLKQAKIGSTETEIDLLLAQMKLEAVQQAYKKKEHLKEPVILDFVKKEEEEPQEAKPKTIEEELRRRAKERQDAGAHRTTKETGKETDKGKSKKQGGTRQPKKAQETELPQPTLEITGVLETTPQDINVKVETTPQEIVVSMDPEQLAIQRSEMDSILVQMKKEVDEDYSSIREQLDDSKDQTEELYKRIEGIQDIITESMEKLKVPTEDEVKAREAQSLKIELYKQLLRESKALERVE